VIAFIEIQGSEHLGALLGFWVLRSAQAGGNNPPEADRAGINRRPYAKIKANRRISNTECRISKGGFASGFAFGLGATTPQDDPTGRSVELQRGRGYADLCGRG